MDKDVTLHWQGPAWFAGRTMPGSIGMVPGLTADVDLLEAYQDGRKLPSAVPSAILVDTTCVTEMEGGEAFYIWLNQQIDQLECDIPLVYLCAAADTLPDRPRPHAVMDRQIPDDILFLAVSDLQRALLRSEEARIRRLTFGRIHGYTGSERHRGGSGLLVIGLGKRFLELTHAVSSKVQTIGAFDQTMGESYMAQRAFDAVILNGDYADTHEALRQFRLDPRHASLPVIAIASQKTDIIALFEAGATDVIFGNPTEANLRLRLATAIRSGKRRRLADRALAESHRWLAEHLNKGGIPQKLYQTYLERADQALSKRGLKVCELQLVPQEFDPLKLASANAANLYGTLLSVADATSREEDLICHVRDLGPMAVLKSERGKHRLQQRINAILAHTEI